MDEHQMALVEPGSQQQSVMAVADLSTFGVNFSDDYIFTRADIQEYRREFNAKIINNIVISPLARTERFTRSAYIQIVNRLSLQRPEFRNSYAEAWAYLESLSHDEFFDLVTELWLADDRILDEEGHIEILVKKVPLVLDIRDPHTGQRLMNAVGRILIDNNVTDPWQYWTKSNSKTLIHHFEEILKRPPQYASSDLRGFYRTILDVAVTGKGLSELRPLPPRTFHEWLMNLAQGINTRVKAITLADSYLHSDSRTVTIQAPQSQEARPFARSREASPHPPRGRDYRSSSVESSRSRSRSRDRTDSRKKGNYERESSANKNYPSAPPARQGREANPAPKGRQGHEAAAQHRACKTCGRDHPGVCELTNHPQANHENIPWASSPNGKLCSAFKKEVLPRYWQLDKQFNWVPYEAMGTTDTRNKYGQQRERNGSQSRSARNNAGR